MSWAHINSPWNYEPEPEPARTSAATPVGESRDGHGYADNDRPYVFGHAHFTVNNHFPFSTVGFAHLLRLRGLVRDGILKGDTAPDVKVE